MRERLYILTVVMLTLLLAGPAIFGFDMTVQHTGIPSESVLSSTILTTVAFSSDNLISTVDLYFDHHVEPTLAISDNGTLFAGWKNSETHNGGGAQVSFTKSVDGGETWEDPTDMANFEGIRTRKSDPWLVWHDGSIYYAYLEFSVNDDSLSQITVSKSSDYGATWSQAAASYGSYFADKETMVISDNGTIFVAYDDVDTDPGGLATVRLTRSVDGGNSFDEVSVIGAPADGHLGPYLTLDGESNVFVAWSYFFEVGGNLLLDNSTDFGTTFGEDRFINSDGNYSDFTDADGRPAKVTLPVIRFDSHNRLYCLWADTFDPAAGSFDVYLRYSEDYGFTWSNRILINPASTGDQWMPDMDIDSEDNLHIVYYSEEFESYKPFYRLVSFSGDLRETVNLGSVIAITDVSTSSTYTRPGDYFMVRLDVNGTPHVVWTDGRYNEMDIFYSHGLDYVPTVTTTTTPTSTTTTMTGTTSETSTTDSTSTDTTSTTSTTNGTGSSSPLPMIIGGVIGFGVVLIVAIVLIRRKGPV